MNASPLRQQGAVLIFALVILIVLTLLGISAMQVSTLEETMAGNMKDCNQAFQSAEAAIRDASEWLSSRVTRPVANASASNNVYAKGVYTLGSDNTPATGDFNWGSKAIKYGVLGSSTQATSVIGSCSPGVEPPDSDEMADLSSLPCSVIEEHSFIADDLDSDTAAKGVGRYYYRITARGFGGTDKSQSRLEAILFKRYN